MKMLMLLIVIAAILGDYSKRGGAMARCWGKKEIKRGVSGQGSICLPSGAVGNVMRPARIDSRFDHGGIDWIDAPPPPDTQS
nr:unnamed protein product [Haemonchus contortus]